MTVHLGTSIGIAIRGSHLEAVSLRGRGRRLRVSGFLRIENFRTRPVAEVAQQYRRFREENHALTTSALVAFPRGAGLVRTLELPPEVAPELRQTVAYQVDQLHPFEEGSVYFDYALLPESPARGAGNGTGASEEGLGRRLRVAVALVEKSALDQLYQWFGQAGVDVAGFTLSTAVLYQALRGASLNQSRNMPGLRRPLVLLDHCGQVVELLGVAPDGAFYSKEVAAGSSLQREVEFCAAELRLDPQDSPQMLESGEGIAPEPEIREQQVREQAAVRDSAPSSGSPAEGIPVVTPEAGPAEFRLKEHLVAYAAALPGLELRLPLMAPPAGLRWNLLPAEKRYRSHWRSHWRSRWTHTLAYALVVLVLLLGAAWLATTWMQDRFYSSWLNSEISKLRPQVERLEQMDYRHQSLLLEWGLLQGQRQDIALRLEAWKELTRLVPDTAWLQTLHFKDNQVTASGQAQSASGILQAINQSPHFQQPEFITAITKSKQGREAFQIRMRLRETPARAEEVASHD